jgi:hypothetical protein
LRKVRRTTPSLTTPGLVLVGRRSSHPEAGTACPVEDDRSRIAVAAAAAAVGSRSLAVVDREDSWVVGRHSSLQRHLEVVADSCQRMIAVDMSAEHSLAEGLWNGPR